MAALFSFLVLLFPALQRQSYLCVASVLCAAAYYGRQFLGFAIVSGIAYLIVRTLGRQKLPARRWRWACIAIVVLAIVFTLGRAEEWNRPWPLGATQAVVYSLGMWPALKLVTLFWEIGSGSIATPSLARYVVWTCLPFTLGGPVLRLSQMPDQLSADQNAWKTANWWRAVAQATAMLAGGIFLGVFLRLFPFQGPHAHLLSSAFTTFVSGPLSFYLTTAGYFAWMEVLARPAGLNLPESFRYPIGRENISAFWMHWNMTATFVFRDYLFYNRWGGRTYNIYFNTILLFTLVGLWHESNPYWILWGFLHGLLFSTYLLWRKFGNRLGTIPLRGTMISSIAGRAFTYFCVCMCWYLPSKLLQKFAGGLI